ncbi:hypothetical protein SUGI_0708390 [Cryptomeria japonica]|nr:hypothetical protein SUGI_0708390 [Cryptomeria japonica]
MCEKRLVVRVYIELRSFVESVRGKKRCSNVQYKRTHKYRGRADKTKVLELTSLEEAADKNNNWKIAGCTKNDNYLSGRYWATNDRQNIQVFERSSMTSSQVPHHKATQIGNLEQVCLHEP